MSKLVHFSRSADVFEAAERLFDDVQGRIRLALPKAEIQHVGSTAIRGSLTKGDLDVLVRVSRGDFHVADRILSEMYSRNEGSDRADFFSAFVDLSSSPELGIQLVASGTAHDIFAEWIEMLASDDELSASYEALKARHHGRDMAEYRKAKSAFIERNLGNKGDWSQDL